MRLNQIVWAVLEWPCDKFDKFRDWLLAGELPPKVHPLDKRCYLTSETHLSGARVTIGFESLEDAQEAHELLMKRNYCAA